MLNDDMKDLEQIVYNKMLEDFKNIEKSLTLKVLNDNFSILIGEHELIEDFSYFLESNDIDIGQDINYILIGHDLDSAEPVKIVRTNRRTNDTKLLEICLIKKSDKFMNLISEKNIDEDLNKLIYLELDLSDTGKKCIYSNCLGKDDEMNEKNVLEVVAKLFNIERSIKGQICDFVKKLKTEQENNDIMYV